MVCDLSDVRNTRWSVLRYEHDYRYVMVAQ
jgi:hypothetical protein